MNEYAEIHITRHELPLGRQHLTFDWIGSPLKPVRISVSPFRGFSVDKLPWPMIKIESDPAWGVDCYLRIDGFLRPWSWLVRFRYWIKRLLEPIYYRLILTAMVWGLAYTPPGTVPSWHDLGKKNPHDA